MHACANCRCWQVIFAVFPNTCKNVVDYWRCHEIFVDEFTSEYYLFADYAQQCYVGAWLDYLPVGIIGTLLYPIGSPLLFFGLLFPKVRNDELNNEDVVAKYGFLYCRFKPDFW